MVLKLNFSSLMYFPESQKKYDIIVSNPPYISPAEFTGLPSEVKDFEPGNALLSEENGLYFYRKILNEVEKYLTDNGKIYFEIGHDQAEEIRIIALERGFSKITVFQDLNGFDRIMRIEKKLAAKTV